jgi:hypothetical protein
VAESKALAFVPSGTFYARQAMARGPRAWGPPVAFGDPQYGAGTYDRLPGSRREVSAVAAVFPDTRTNVRGQATEERVKPRPQRPFRALRGARHRRRTRASRLRARAEHAIRARRRRETGLLHAWEIFERVRLDADLVTLSACRSASGAGSTGEGILGPDPGVHLRRRAQRPGLVVERRRRLDRCVHAVVLRCVGPWPGQGRLLRRAQVDAIRRGQRPLRWAGFQLYGDDR